MTNHFAPRPNATRPLHTSPHQGGFTLTEIMIVVALVGLLAAIVVPNFVRARTRSQMSACISNLHQISSAIDQFAAESRRQSSAPVTHDQIVPYLRGTTVCPAGGTSFEDSYQLLTVADGATCALQPDAHVLTDASGPVTPPVVGRPDNKNKVDKGNNGNAYGKDK